MSAALSAKPAISRGGSGLPSRVVMHGVEGVGKSSCWAFAPNPVFLMTRGETGLLTLIDSGLANETDHFDEAQTWSELIVQVRHLLENDTGHKTVVIDTINGAERLCFEHVTREKFKGDAEAFLAYGKGPDIAQAEWIRLLGMLDELRAARKVGVAGLCHTKIKTFRNPEGDDYDRYQPDMNDKTWGLTAKWADVVLFANFETFAKRERGAMRAKGFGGDQRVFYTQRTAAYDAKNRLGLPAEIPMTDGPDGGWRALSAALKDARARLKTKPTQENEQ